MVVEGFTGVSVQEDDDHLVLRIGHPGSWKSFPVKGRRKPDIHHAPDLQWHDGPHAARRHSWEAIAIMEPLS